MKTEIRRTILSEDIQSILNQNDKILNLNREILRFIKEQMKSCIINTDSFNISNEGVTPGNLWS